VLFYPWRALQTRTASTVLETVLHEDSRGDQLLSIGPFKRASAVVSGKSAQTFRVDHTLYLSNPNKSPSSANTSNYSNSNLSNSNLSNSSGSSRCGRV
jgi:hypothetical protein